MTAQVSGATQRPAGLTVVALLALVGAAVGIFWAVRWFYLAGELTEGGVFLLPLAGGLMFVRAVIATVIALLYLAFARGAFARRDWAWAVGMLAVVLNGLEVVALILSTDALGWILLRGVIALVILCYLVSPAGRAALGSTATG